MDFLDLKELPGSGTLQKIAQRIRNKMLDKLLMMFAGNRSNARVSIR